MDSATDKLFDEARALLRQGALNEAAQRFADILRSDPANADALYHLAQVNCRQDRIVEGIGLVRRAFADRFPASARAQSARPCAQPARANARGAGELRCRDRRRSRLRRRARQPRRRSSPRLGRKQEAVESYDRAIALDPGSFANWCNRGAALYELRRFRGGGAKLRARRCDRPRRRAGPFQSRQCADRPCPLRGRPRRLRGRARASQPQHLDALYNRGCLLSKLKRYRRRGRLLRAAADDRAAAPAAPSASSSTAI